MQAPELRRRGAVRAGGEDHRRLEDGRLPGARRALTRRLRNCFAKRRRRKTSGGNENGRAHGGTAKQGVHKAMKKSLMMAGALTVAGMAAALLAPAAPALAGDLNVTSCGCCAYK